MFVQVGALAALACVLWYASTRSPSREPGRWPAAWLVALVIPSLAVASLLAASTSLGTELRLRLGEVRFLESPAPGSSTPAAPVVVVGSRRESVDLLVPRAPDALVSLTLDPEQKPPAELIVRYLPSASGPPIGASGAVLAEWGGERRVVSGVPLSVGDRVEIDRGAGSREIVSIDGPRRVSVDGQSVDLGWSVRLPWLGVRSTFRYPDVRTRTYPLSEVIDPGGVSGQVPLASFFFFEPRAGGFRGALWLALLDPAVRVVSASGSASSYVAEHRLPLIPDTPLRLRFCGLGTAAETLEIDHEHRGLRDFRSGVVRTPVLESGAAVLQMSFDTVETLNLTSDLLDLLALDDDEGGRQRWHLTLVPDVLVPKAITFQTLPPKFGPAGQAILELSDGDKWIARVPSGEIALDYGRAVWFGDTFQAAVQIDRMTASRALLAWIVFAGVLVAAVVAVALPAHPRLFAVAAAVQVLLAFKLLLGFKAWTGVRSSFESHALALYAAVVTMLVLVVAVRMREGDERDRFALAAIWALALLSATVGMQFLGWPALLVALAIPCALPSTRWRALPSTPWRSLRAGWLPWIWKGQGPERLAEWAGRRPATYAFCAGFLLFAVRALLAALGIRERLPFGVPIALSILYVPLVLAGYAVLRWAWSHTPPRASASYVWSWSLYFFWACLATGIVVSDFGIPLILLVPLGIDLVSVVYDASRARQSARNLIVVAALASILVGGLLAWRFMPARIVQAIGWSGEGASLLEWDRNKLRLLHYTYPPAVTDIGRRESEELVIMSEVLARYTDSGWLGQGYPRSEVSPQLGPTVLREHAPAVFVASDFGHIGVAIVAIAYVLALVAWHGTGTGAAQTREGLGGTLSGLAAATFVCSSLYMLAANYDMVPFTGKNAYLLGLDSFSDLIESLVLIGLATRGMGVPDPSATIGVHRRIELPAATGVPSGAQPSAHGA